MSSNRTLVCKVGGCKTKAARPDARVCSDHQHTLILQAELVRLQNIELDGVALLVHQYPHLRRLVENLATLSFRADPLKAASTQIVARSRSNNLDDGIAVVGDHLATPGYAVSTRSDRGRLRAAEREIAKCADDVARIVTGQPKPKERRPRCNHRSCDKRDIRQPVGVRVCGFCGLPMNTGNPVPVPASQKSHEERPRRGSLLNALSRGSKSLVAIRRSTSVAHEWGFFRPETESHVSHLSYQDHLRRVHSPYSMSSIPSARYRSAALSMSVK